MKKWLAGGLFFAGVLALGYSVLDGPIISKNIPKRISKAKVVGCDRSLTEPLSSTFSHWNYDLELDAGPLRKYWIEIDEASPIGLPRSGNPYSVSIRTNLNPSETWIHGSRVPIDSDSEFRVSVNFPGEDTVDYCASEDPYHPETPICSEDEVQILRGALDAVVDVLHSSSCYKEFY